MDLTTAGPTKREMAEAALLVACSRAAVAAASHFAVHCVPHFSCGRACGSRCWSTTAR